MASLGRDIIAGQMPAARAIFRRWQRITSRPSGRGVESEVWEVMCTTLRYLHVPLTIANQEPLEVIRVPPSRCTFKLPSFNVNMFT